MIATTTGLIGILVVFLLDRDGDAPVLTTRAVMTLLWPLVVMSLVDRCDMTHPALVPSMLWMALVWCVDSYGIVNADVDVSTAATERRAVETRPPSHPPRTKGVHIDAHTITAMSFGLSGLVGARYDSRYVHLILYALMMCIMFVLPRHGLPDGDPFTEFVDEMQRTCLVYAIALLITGVTLTRAHNAHAVRAADGTQPR